MKAILRSTGARERTGQAARLAFALSAAAIALSPTPPLFARSGQSEQGANVPIGGVDTRLIGSDGLITDYIGSFDAEDYARQLAQQSSSPPSDDEGSNALPQSIVKDDQINYLTGDPDTWPAELEATVAAPDNHKILLANDYVRVLEVTLGPGKVEPVHFHRWPSVLYIQQADQWLDRDAEGNVIFDSRQGPPLQLPLTMWTGPEAPHSPVNLSDSVEIRLIRVEIKGDTDESDQRSASADEMEIRAAIANWVEVYNRNDWELLANQFTEDAVMMPPNPPAVVGRSAIAQWEAANEDGFRIALLPKEISVTGDRAFVRGRSCVFIPLDGANTGVDVGKFLEVRHRQSDGRWLVSHDVFNSDLPAGGDLPDSCPEEIANGILEGIDAENETISANPAVFSLSTLPRDVLGPLVTRQVVNGTQMTFSRWELNKGARVPMHRHANEQISWIISGKAQITSGGRTYMLGPGNIMVFPPNVEHQVDILEDTVAADIFAPQRQDWIDQAAKAAGLSQQTCRIERAPGAVDQCKGENQ